MLRLASVNQRATVYLNDILLGSHQGGYLPLELRASSLRPGPLNELLVMVDNRSLARSVQRAARWWNSGGILREVYLRPQGAVDISGVRTRQEISRESALVDVTAQLRNTTTRRQRGRLACTIGDDQVTKSFAVAAGEPARVRGILSSTSAAVVPEVALPVPARVPRHRGRARGELRHAATGPAHRRRA